MDERIPHRPHGRDFLTKAARYRYRPLPTARARPRIQVGENLILFLRLRRWTPPHPHDSCGRKFSATPLAPHQGRRALFGTI